MNILGWYLVERFKSPEECLIFQQPGFTVVLDCSPEIFIFLSGSSCEDQCEVLPATPAPPARLVRLILVTRLLPKLN